MMEADSLSNQFAQDKLSFDRMFQGMIDEFEKERKVFREEIKTLLQRVSDLRNSVQNTEAPSARFVQLLT